MKRIAFLILKTLPKILLIDQNRKKSKTHVTQVLHLWFKVKHNWNMSTISGENSRERSRIYREQLITIEDLETLKANLLDEIRKLLKEEPQRSDKKYLRSSEVRKMLGISSGTLQSLRVNGTVSYTRVGSLIFYNKEDIVKLLESGSNRK